MSALVEVKTAELQGLALDWAVAIAEGAKPERPQDGQVSFSGHHVLCGTNEARGYKALVFYSPSTDWAHGGPLIEKHGASIILEDGNWWAGFQAVTQSMCGMGFDGAQATGPTALIAACRAIVAAKLGDTVRVPAELVGGGV